jgi:hypothetical protein
MPFWIIHTVSKDTILIIFFYTPFVHKTWYFRIQKMSQITFFLGQIEYYIVSNNLVNFFLCKLPRNAILYYPHGLQRHNFDCIFFYTPSVHKTWYFRIQKTPQITWCFSSWTIDLTTLVWDCGLHAFMHYILIMRDYSLISKVQL